MDRQIASNNMEANPLAREYSFWGLIRFAFPTIVMMLFMGLYTVMDTIFVARFVNTDALSSINIVCPVINIIVGAGTMLATGGSAIIAKEMGEGKQKSANENFTWIICVGVFLGMMICLLGVLHIRPLILALGATQRLYPYCRDYLFVLLLFVPASMFQVLYQNLFVTAGRPGFGLVLAVGAGILNIILDYVFLVIFPMGIKGSALGTGMGYLFVAVIGTVYFLCNKKGLRFVKPKIRWRILCKCCTNGVSEMVSQMANAVTTFLFNWMMMRLLGEDGVAAITILIYMQFLLSTIFIGYSMGTAPILSFAYGERNKKKVKDILKRSLFLILVFSIFVFGVTIGCRTTLAGLFADYKSEVYKIALNGFLIFPVAFLFCGINIYSSSFFTALSDGKTSALISFMRTFGFLLISLLIFPRIFGVDGIWAAVPVAEFFTLILSIYTVRKQS